AAAERRAADDHLVEDAAEGPHVASLVGETVLDLLWREVRRRADDLARAREHVAVAGLAPALRDAEVDEDDAPFGGHEQDGRRPRDAPRRARRRSGWRSEGPSRVASARARR